MDSNKTSKQVNWWHLLYTIAICVLICIGVILCQQKAVCETAMTNFSFAATITSIVLAVVSIVYSIISGTGVNENLGSIQSIEGKIREQLESFQQLGDSIARRVALSNDQLSQEVKETNKQLSDVKKQLNEWEVASKAPAGNNQGGFDVMNNSFFGNLMLYVCFKLNSIGYKNKPVNIVQLISPNLDPNYIMAFFVALSGALGEKCIVIADGNEIKLIEFDPSFFLGIDTYFTSQDFKERAGGNIEKEITEILKNINTFISGLNDSV